MTEHAHALTADQIFDGTNLRSGQAVVLRGGRIVGVIDRAARPQDMPLMDLGAGILGPGFVDLQVNGGAGIMLNDDPSPAGLTRIATAHAGLGATTILPTLISDLPEKTRAVIDAVAQASLGICAIVGCTLNLSAYTLWCDGRQGNEESGAGAYLRVAPFATMRFFLSHSVWHRTRV